jgi:hypothetical protein
LGDSWTLAIFSRSGHCCRSAIKSLNTVTLCPSLAYPPPSVEASALHRKEHCWPAKMASKTIAKRLRRVHVITYDRFALFSMRSGFAVSEGSARVLLAVLANRQLDRFFVLGEESEQRTTDARKVQDRLARSLNVCHVEYAHRSNFTKQEYVRVRTRFVSTRRGETR